MTDRGPPRVQRGPFRPPVRPQEWEGLAALSLKRNMPLVPAESIAGRALVTVIAIMTFLAALAAGSGVLVGEASRGWMDSVSKEMTIQVKPVTGRDIEADVRRAEEIARAAPGVVTTRIFNKAQSAHLLEPWLGVGLDLGELPIPRLIVLELGAGRFDPAALRRTLAERAPNALLDDHRLWMERLAAMARALVGLVTLIFALVLVAMALAVTFATRGAMAGNREILDVLHFVGAEDSFIAREFQRHFLWLGLRGGFIGGGCAMAAISLSGMISGWFSNSAESDQLAAMFGGFGLGVAGYLAILIIAIGVGLLTAGISRTIVFRHLRSLN